MPFSCSLCLSQLKSSKIQLLGSICKFRSKFTNLLEKEKEKEKLFRRPYKANYENFLERESNERELSQPIRLRFKAKIETLASSELLSRSPEKINLSDFPAKKSVIAAEKLLRESMFGCEFFFYYLFIFNCVCEFCC